MTEWEDEADQWRPLDLMIYENFVLSKFGRSTEANFRSCRLMEKDEGAEEAGRAERKRASHTAVHCLPNIILKTNQF